MKHPILRFLIRLGLWQSALAVITAPLCFVLLAGSDSILLFTHVGASLAVLSLVAGAFLTLPLAFFCAVLQSLAVFQRRRRPDSGLEAAP